MIIIDYEQIYKALEAAVGGTWEGGQEYDLSSEGSLESGENPKLSNKSGTRPRKKCYFKKFFFSSGLKRRR